MSELGKIAFEAYCTHDENEWDHVADAVIAEYERRRWKEAAAANRDAAITREQKRREYLEAEVV